MKVDERSEAEGDDPADVAYRWTIRVLYAVAIGLNVWMMIDMAKDDTELAVYKAKVLRAWNQAVQPIRDRAHFPRSRNRMFYEAEVIVEEAAANGAGGVE